MQLVRNLAFVFIAVAMVVLGALFAVQNEARVPLDLLVVYLPERSVALWVLLAFAVGGITGLLTSLGIILRLRTRLMAANRRLAKQAASDSPAAEPAAEPKEES